MALKFTPSRQLILIGFLQTVLLLIGFGRYIFYPQKYMTLNRWDGIKNYFTYQYYIEYNKPGFWGLFTGMNYPFGEYIFYSDNTPVFAVFMRILHQWGLLPSTAAIPVAHFFIVFNFLLATCLFAWLGQRFGLGFWFNMLMSIGAVWISPEIFRFFGTPNMAIISFFAGALCLMYLAHHEILTGKWPVKPAIGLVALTVLAGFFHLYNLAILGIWIGAFGFFDFFIHRGTHRYKALPLISVPVLALAFTLLIIRLVDSRLKDRPPGQGMNTKEWTLQPNDVLKSYSILKSPRILEHSDWNVDRFSYLGSAVIWGSLLAIVYAFVLGGALGIAFRRWRDRKPGFLLAFWLAGLISWFTALGDFVVVPGVISFDNWVSPFYFMDLFTEHKTQFRCLGRFSWPVFYSTWFVFFAVAQWMTRQLPKPAAWLMGSLITIFAALDIRDMVRFFNTDIKYDNLFSKENLSKLPELPYDEYQAIFPLPFFHVGNEVMNKTVDDEELTSTFSFQLSLKTGLPIVACKMSRTPLDQTEAHFSLLLDSVPDPSLLALMNEKPLLVIYKKNYPAIPPVLNTAADSIRHAGMYLPERKGMEKIIENQEFIFYKWNFRAGK